MLGLKQRRVTANMKSYVSSSLSYGYVHKWFFGEEGAVLEVGC